MLTLPEEHGSREDDRARAAADIEPFLLPGGPVGCLLIHGFTATPWEMRFLGEQLHAAGHTVSAVRLAGHGTESRDLASATWQDWYASAGAALATLRERTTSVIVVGQSMGALLALELAADHGTAIAGVAVLSPALQLSRRWLQRAAPLLRLAVAVFGARLFEKGESDIADPAARAACPSARQVPLHALHQFLRLQHRTRRRLAAVQQPVLIIHSRQDHSCPMDNVALLQSGLRGTVQTVHLQDSYHVVSVDVEKERVAAAVGAFVAELVSSATPR